MKEHYINQLDNFIAGWYSPNLELCDMLVAYHKASKDKEPGKTEGFISELSDKEIKFSMDVYLEPKGIIQPFVKEILNPCFDLYKEKYQWCIGYTPWAMLESPIIQHYPPGGGFYEWHTERSSGEKVNASRHLVFLTYLSDVDDCGETEFFHQNVKIKPEKGLTLIWPVDWTFTHRGIPSMTQDKYVLTGWVNYLDMSEISPEELARSIKKVEESKGR